MRPPASPAPLHSGLRGVICPVCSEPGIWNPPDCRPDWKSFVCLNLDCPESRGPDRCRGCHGKRRIGAHGKFVCVSGAGFHLVRGACPEWEEHLLFCATCGSPGRDPDRTDPLDPRDRFCREADCPDSVSRLSSGLAASSGWLPDRGPGELVFGTRGEAGFVRWKWDTLADPGTDSIEKMKWEASTGKPLPERFDWEGFTLQFSRGTPDGIPPGDLPGRTPKGTPAKMKPSSRPRKPPSAPVSP